MSCPYLFAHVPQGTYRIFGAHLHPSLSAFPRSCYAAGWVGARHSQKNVCPPMVKWDFHGHSEGFYSDLMGYSWEKNEGSMIL